MRFIAGAAIGAIMPLGLAWIGDNISYTERPATLARFTAAATSGGVFGQATAGMFSDTLGWNITFLVPGLIFLCTGLMLRGPARRAPTPAAGTGGLAGVLAAYRAILVDPRSRALIIFVALEGALGYGAVAFIPSYLHLRHEIPLWQAGLIIGGFGIGGLLFAIVSRRLIGRLGERGLVAVGSTGLMLGLVGVVAMPVLAGAIAACLLLGFGFYMMHNTVQTRGTQLAPATRGIGLACMALALFSGQAVGVAGTAAAIDRIGYGAAIAGTGLLCAVLGAVITIWLRRNPPLMDR
jgi:predicted MFS family arabinose efflux permease